MPQINSCGWFFLGCTRRRHSVEPGGGHQEGDLLCQHRGGMALHAVSGMARADLFHFQLRLEVHGQTKHWMNTASSFKDPFDFWYKTACNVNFQWGPFTWTHQTSRLREYRRYQLYVHDNVGGNALDLYEQILSLRQLRRGGLLGPPPTP